jgi:predicted DsbA family dithiol-disulfide isomerase
VIEVVSDVVCPWCWIGKRRLEKALELIGRKGLAVRWRPFELNPGMPKEGMDRVEYRARKFGNSEYARKLEDRVVAAGAGEGIEFAFDRVARVPNTFEAHRLLWLAGQGPTQGDVAESLFRAYFIEGEDIGDTAVLTAIGERHGVAFPAGAGAAEVTADLEWARHRGLDSVPAFFVNGQPVTSGAHPAELLACWLQPPLELARG